MKVLTSRELEVLALIAKGHSNAAICADLWLSRKTVETHVRNIYRKLELPPADVCHRRVMAVLVHLAASSPRDLAA